MVTLFFVSASTAVPQSSLFRYEAYSVDQGLSQSSVWSILQDSQGFMWFGTADGLNRYDGHSFRIFRHDARDSTSIAKNNIYVLHEDRAGNVWIGTSAGLNKYDRHSDSFERLVSQERYQKSFLALRINSILEDRSGRLWFGTVEGLVIVAPDGNILKQIPDADLGPSGSLARGLSVFSEDDQGGVWITNFGYLFRCDPTTWKFDLVGPNGLDQRIRPFRWFEDHDGTRWIGTMGNGVWSFEPRTNQWRRYIHDPHDAASVCDSTISSIGEDNEGRLWFGGPRNGLCFLDRSTGKFHPFKPTPGGEKNGRYEGVTAIRRDRSGLLWVGYDGAGVIKINPYERKFRHVLLPRSTAGATGDNFFKAIMADHLGDVWLGTYDQGIVVWNDSTSVVRRYPHKNSGQESPSGNSIVAFLEDKKNNVWVGTMSGLDEFDRSRGRFVHHPIPRLDTDGVRGRIVQSLCEDGFGNIWCGTASRLLKYDRPTNRLQAVLPASDLSNAVIPTGFTVLTLDTDGMLWIGTHGAGVVHVRNDGTVLERFQHNPSDVQSLSHNVVKSILLADGGVLWIGTEEGLNRFDRTTQQWNIYRTSDGLPNDFIYGVLMDDQKRLWISTNRGLSRMDASDPDRPLFRNFTVDDGLQSYEFNTGSYYEMQDGRMLFGGVNGFNIFHPDSVEDNHHIPSVVFTGFKKFDQPFDLGADIGVLEEVRLEPEESVFSFEFVALEFTNPASNRYAYKMEGFDNEWIYCGTRREARYTNLDPGEYTFHVKGSNNDGVWNEKGTSIRVVVVPPFWKTGWFIFCATAFGVAVFGASIRYVSTRKLRRKIEQLEREKAIQEERQRTRERIARDLHDDLASTVGSAGLFIESVKHQLPDAPTEAKEFLDRTSSLLTEAEQAMSDIVWSVSPQHDTLDSLLLRIRLLTVDVCKAAGMKYEVDVDAATGDHRLAEDMRRSIFLVFKEAVNNAARHSGATLVRVKIKVAEESLELTISDNGKGLPAKRDGPTQRGHGLRNMENRAKEIGAEYSLVTAEGKGTTIQLTVRIT
ncbi:MAG: two-component regulator propeller domain-containing protein [Bacteroidota bacterium]